METRKTKKGLADLLVIPIQEEPDEQNVRRPLHPNLPNVYKGQLLCLVSPLRGGKGTLWNNLILRDTMYNDLFPVEATTIISNTIRTDSSSRFSYQKFKNTCFDTYSDNIITDLIKSQKAKIDNGNEDTAFCVILDDLMGQFPKNGRKGMAAINFSSRFRHYVKKPDPCLILFSTQRYFDLSKVCRSNATGIFFSGNIKSRKEWDQIIDDYGDTFGGRAKFISMIKEVQKEPYNFLYLKLDTTPVEAYKNFQTQLF